jgi:hypothetical protein
MDSFTRYLLDPVDPFSRQPWPDTGRGSRTSPWLGCRPDRTISSCLLNSTDRAYVTGRPTTGDMICSVGNERIDYFSSARSMVAYVDVFQMTAVLLY